MLSLRTTIGAMTALVVCIVAAAALSVTIVYAHDALRTIGEAHAGSLLRIAASRTVTFVNLPMRVAEAIQLDVASQDVQPPGTEAAPFDRFRCSMQVHYSVLRSAYPDVTSCWSVFTDGSSVNIQLDRGAERDDDVFVHRAVLVFPNGIAAHPFGRHGFYAANGSEVPNALAGDAVARDFRYLFDPGFSFYRILQSRNITPAMWLVGVWAPVDDALYKVTSATGEDTIHFSLAVAVALRDARGRDIGVSTVNIELARLDEFMRSEAVRRTPGAQAFGLTRDGYLLGSSYPAPWRNVTAVDANTTSNRNHPGCGFTARLVPGGQNWRGCRMHASEYPFAPLRDVVMHASIASSSDGADGHNVEQREVDGDVFFVAWVAVRAENAVGLDMRLILFLPERSVLGDVATGRNIAIGVTCAVFLVATAAAVVGVTIVLRPLSTLSRRMCRSAALQIRDDTDAAALLADNTQHTDAHTVSDASEHRPHDAHSSNPSDRRSHPSARVPQPGLVMMEIEDLQTSYAELCAQLARIRDFVPQSVLLASDGRDGYSPDESAVSLRDPDGSDRFNRDESTPRSQSDRSGSLTASAATANTAGAAAGRTRRSHYLSAARNIATGMLVGLSARPVSVVAVNLVGFHATALNMDSRTLAIAVADFVETVAKHTADHGGVFDSIHGDRVLLTFNAALPLATHVRRAAATALALASEPIAFALPLRAAVASGAAFVGNMGSDVATRFCVVGAVVTRAATLLRFAAMAPNVPTLGSTLTSGSRVLVSGRIVEDLVDMVTMRSIGLVQLPSDGPSDPEMVCDIVGPRDAAPVTAEWMFVVGQQQPPDQRLELPGDADTALQQQQQQPNDTPVPQPAAADGVWLNVGHTPWAPMPMAASPPAAA